ncbi:uncharacterized protein TRAVEDRAFT_173142 [Trametes versicolor FP-101664 SS1]|uniref:uncharacterized protein n=1 Tax=Trametes versicolor (strain FP-101664) TaxID=717944 RepID=UPI0004622189|nr:uncharacterized protein TRAVEDRAFT_173142 [Trametes versicolor FP-101664 SS1]EIW55420.1 hypothetical protein TRAVEDRAFT_173142 [Trametes versicolor FP-101664 SS1]
MAPTTTATPPGLQEATRNSTTNWQDDLQALFDHAKERFADVVWELQSEASAGAEEVWGHKAVVYARAPPSFQARYFSFKPPPAASPLPYSSSPTGTLPAQSALSLNLGLGVDFSSPSRSPSPAAYRSSSPAPSTNTGALLRIPTTINSTLFSNELEYLYTGKGLGSAFEFLFDSTDGAEGGDTDEGRVDKLRKDFVFMWRSRLYSDVRIALTGVFSSTNHESTTAIFSSHRFILVSRVPYFNTQLLQWGVKHTPGEPLTLNLPSPPFTPASLHFTLGFIYTGTLIFSHRTFDLDTAFHIMRSATYLSLDSLYDEIQARIVQEMMHGLFHAFLEFSEYEAITGGKWGTGGCRCRQCARRAPRVLEFAVLDDVKNAHLERGARRALVGLFGEGWCTAEFAALPQKTRDALLKGLGKRTTPLNVFALLQAAQSAIKKLDTMIDTWTETVRDMVVAARKTIDDVVCSHAAECFELPEWSEIMEADGVRFEDGEKVEMLLESMRRGLNEKNAAMAYQSLVDLVLLRPHPTDPEAAMLSSTSHVRVQVEQARMDIVRYIRRRWLTIKQEDGFAGLEPWAAKEIATELELKDETELVGPTTPTSTARGGRLTVRNGPVSKAEESDTVSMHSTRSTATSRRPPDTLKTSAASVRSLARSTHSTNSRVTTASHVTTTTLSRRVPLSPGSLRPDSKLTPAHSTPSPSARGSVADSARAKSPLSPSPSPVPRSNMSTASVRKPSTPSLHSTAERFPRPKSVAASVKSVAASVKSTRSTTSTIRKGAAGPSTLRPPSSAASRPASTLSNSSMSENSTAFETARSELTASNVTRQRRLSAASAVSTTSVRTTGTSTPRIPRRPPSVTSRTTSSVSKRPPPSPAESGKTSPVAKRTVSTTSIRSTISNKSTTTRKSVVRSTPGTPSTKPPLPTRAGSKAAQDENGAGGTIKSKAKSPPSLAHEKQGSVVSSTSTSTLKRKSSADTIREAEPAAKLPSGATLDIGIPCIISSKKARFRAYARYIGEVEGEAGPWVGVEVPLNDAWPGDKLDGRAWHDGTWGGIRYFDIGAASEWEFGQDTTARRRRNEWLSTLGRDSKTSLKREGDQLSIERAKRLRSVSPAVSDMSSAESRGLFVRPQQVLYVVDAVGTDL